MVQVSLKRGGTRDYHSSCIRRGEGAGRGGSLSTCLDAIGIDKEGQLGEGGVGAVLREDNH